MFLISKIVRGRRLLHELEAETEKKTAREAAMIEPSAMIIRQNTQSARAEKFMGETSQSGVGTSNANITYTTTTPSSCSTTLSNLTIRPSKAVLSEIYWQVGRILKVKFERKNFDQKRDSSLPDGVETDLDADLNDLTVMPSRLRRSSSMPSVSDPIIRPILKHYDYNSRLNRLQKRFLRFTWHRLQTRNGGKRIASVFEEVYERLLKQLPGIWKMFTTRTFLSAMSRSEIATPRDHARETVKLIDYAIKNLELSDKGRNDTGSDYDPFLLGKMHGRLRPYGFTGNYWEKLGEIIVDVVLVQEAVRDLPGAGQAWVIFIACLVDQLRAGFDDSKSGLTSTTGTLQQKFICGSANSNNAVNFHQHSLPSADTPCYSSPSHCYGSQPFPSEYTSTLESETSDSPTFDSSMSSKWHEGRNCSMSGPAAEHNTSTFRSSKRSSARFLKHSKGICNLNIQIKLNYASEDNQYHTTLFQNSSNTQVLNPELTMG
ncbi:unnamed protein product [Cercopithifilaria johnstoni]|uniref:Globin family profile domain-containing protein n=1 Tax=Cercopithifilaria johnstoni TaxID=2874296 RepID=A0A8J2MJG3_9BILA|nr:unnamed protein product [Cercopithifilaria johnstoni]